MQEQKVSLRKIFASDNDLHHRVSHLGLYYILSDLCCHLLFRHRLNQHTDNNIVEIFERLNTLQADLVRRFNLHCFGIQWRYCLFLLFQMKMLEAQFSTFGSQVGDSACFGCSILKMNDSITHLHTYTNGFTQVCSDLRFFYLVR